MTLLPRAAVFLLPFALAACSSLASAPKPAPPSPAEALRAWDNINTRTANLGSVADYQAAFDKVTPKCTNDPSKLPAMVEATDAILVKGGVTDENGLSILGHLSDSIPAGAPAMDCTDILAAYATLRTG